MHFGRDIATEIKHTSSNHTRITDLELLFDISIVSETDISPLRGKVWSTPENQAIQGQYSQLVIREK